MTKTVALNVSKATLVQVVSVMQGDPVTLQCSLSDGTTAYSPTGYDVVTCEGETASGHAVAISGTLSGSTVTVPFTANETEEAGDVKLAIRFSSSTDTNLRISTFPFILKVTENPSYSAVGQMDNVSALTDYVDEAKSAANSATSAMNNITDSIDSSVNTYLGAHPVTGGATEAQAAQITKNAGDIGELTETLDNYGSIINVISSKFIDTYMCDTEQSTINILLDTLQFEKNKSYTFYLSADVTINNSFTQFIPTLSTKSIAQEESYYYTRLGFNTYKASDNYSNMKIRGSFALSNREDSLNIALSFTNCINARNRLMLKNIRFVIVDSTNLSDASMYYDYFDLIAGKNKNAVVLPEQPTTKNNTVNCWGDSLTQGVGATDCPYPTVLQTLIGNEFTVNNYGVGGESIYPIMGRMGSALMYTNNIVIQANSVNPIPIELFSTIANQGANLRDKTGLKGLSNVSIDGVDGSITVSDDFNTIYFTPTNGLPIAKTINRDSLILPKKDNSNDINIVFMGQNGGWNTTNWFINEYRQIEKWCKSNKYIFIGLTTGTYTERHQMELEFGFAFGGHYLNAREYLVKYGLSDNGLNPTEADNTAIENGEVPPQLLSDAVHGNDFFYKSLAKAIYIRGKGLGYWN